MDSNFQEAQEEALEEYLQLLQEEMEEYLAKKKIIDKECEEASLLLQEEKDKVLCAINARKITEMEINQKKFYCLQLSKNDLDDINYLNNVAEQLHAPEVLYKTIWKVYYEKPYNDLIGRILGDKDPCGIYKITNELNGKSYVGQSVSIKERWRQHLKRGCGAEAPTRNKLYPAMIEDGIWNFSFQVLQECDRENLDALEDYWQKYYDVINYGYSIK